MSLQSHLVELEKKHQALEKALHEAQIRPASDDREVAELKRRKLQLRDEISRLQQGKGNSKGTVH